MSNKETLIVAGASGALGQLVLKELLAQYHGKIIATTRDVSKLKGFSDPRLEIRVNDLESSVQEIAESFRGGHRLLLISTNDFGKRLNQHKRAVDAAKLAGVKHIIYTSWLKADQSTAIVAHDHLQTEMYIQGSGLEYTILRNNLYMENLEGTIHGAIQSGFIFGASKGQGVSYISREDCARVASYFLMNSQGGHSVVEVAGQDRLSYEDLARMLNEKFGKLIQMVEKSPEDLESFYVSIGLGKELAHVLVDFEVSASKGELSYLNEELWNKIGLRPLRIADWLKRL